MDARPHDLKTGYYWYTIDGDPPSVIHIHDNGSATLMGTDFKVEPINVAAMINDGETFVWIEPPRLGAPAPD